MHRVVRWMGLMLIGGLCSLPVYAHDVAVNAMSVMASLEKGFIHPFTGLDHMVMLLGFAVLVGQQAYIQQIRSLVQLQSAWVVGLGLAALGVLFSQLIEWTITVTLLLLAVALALQKHRLSVGFAVLLGGAHGAAHGVAMHQDGAIALAFVVGNVLAVSCLFGLGMLAARILQRTVYGHYVAALSVILGGALGQLV